MTNILGHWIFWELPGTLFIQPLPLIHGISWHHATFVRLLITVLHASAPTSSFPFLWILCAGNGFHACNLHNLFILPALLFPLHALSWASLGLGVLLFHFLHTHLPAAFTAQWPCLASRSVVLFGSSQSKCFSSLPVIGRKNPIVCMHERHCLAVIVSHHSFFKRQSLTYSCHHQILQGKCKTALEGNVQPTRLLAGLRGCFIFFLF